METRIITIPQNVTSYNIDNLFLGNVPKNLVIGFVANTAINGRYHMNPFHFQHFNLNKLQVQVGSKFYPPTPLTPILKVTYSFKVISPCFLVLGSFIKILRIQLLSMILHMVIQFFHLFCLLLKI